MDSSIVSALLVLALLSLSFASASPVLDAHCGYCSHPRTRPKPPTVKPSINLPPIVNSPITVPKVPVPPVTVPGKAYSPAPAPAMETCPIDTLKLGVCVDLLGGLIHIGLGDPAANECCPLISGLIEIEAAVCLCTTLKIKALNLNIYVPLAMELILTCGKAPPPGYTCSL